MAGLLSVGPIHSTLLQPPWQLLRAHLITNPKLPSTSPHLCSRSGQCSLTPRSQGNAPSLTRRWGTACSVGGQQPVCPRKHRHVQTTETENPAVFMKQSAVSTGGEEERQCCLLQALPCPAPVWTSGTKHAGAAPERLSPEPARDSHGGYGGFASRVHSLLY